MSKWTTDYSTPEHAATRQNAKERALQIVRYRQNNGGNSYLATAKYNQGDPEHQRTATLHLAAITIAYLRRPERV